MHLRKRHIEAILKKRAKMFPVLGVLGPRQVGKSTFLMKQWRDINKAQYFTFDKQEIALRAKQSAEQFLLSESEQQTIPLIIDEAQKVPHIFDSIKAIVDEKRRLGVFTLSGSVEFSSKSGVRESLAGRMGITRLYPLTLREINNQEFAAPWVTLSFENKTTLKANSIEKTLARGGMPIFCGFDDTDERITMINSWLEAICYRDLKQLKDTEYDSELAFNLLTIIAASPTLLMSKIAPQLGATPAVIKKHLSALESLFLIYKIPSFENPRAQPQYRLFDCGVLNGLLGGKQTILSRPNHVLTLLINEIYAQYEYAGKLKPQLSYYKTRGGAGIDLILKTQEKTVAIECETTVDISLYAQRSMKSFLKKYPDAIGYFIAPVQQSYQLDKNMFVIPWNEIG